MTTAKEFNEHIARHCGPSARLHPRVERDGPYKYECYDNEDGEEIGFISWLGGWPEYVIHKTPC